MRAVGLLCAGLLLNACTGGTPPSVHVDNSAVLLPISAARQQPPQQHDSRASWFARDVGKSRRLLFVSDAMTGDVYIYRVPSLRMAGRATGFSQPEGECSDSGGDVWVTDSSARSIYELSHGGQLENTLKDDSGYPVGCAWDPNNGNLAVMNFIGFNSTGGSVLVYRSASGSPRAYTNSNQYYYNFGAYDSDGNLFFDGRDSKGNFMLSKLAAGASSAHTVAISRGTIYFPGMVQWVGSVLVVGDQSCNNKNASCIYRLSFASKTGTITGVSHLQNSAGGKVCDMAQGVVTGKMIAGSDNDFCGYAPSATYVWWYPQGGAPVATNAKLVSTPVGAAISVK